MDESVTSTSYIFLRIQLSHWLGFLYALSFEHAGFSKLNTQIEVGYFVRSKCLYSTDSGSLANIFCLNLMSVCPCIVDDMKRVKPIRCYTMVYWTLWIAQHVSDIIMPIIRSLRLYRWPQRVAPHCKDGTIVPVGLVL
jgi:hypothetical protein